MRVRFEVFLLAAAGCMTCSIGASAPLIAETNGSGPAAGSHALVMDHLLADPTDALALEAVEFADPVVQLATRGGDAGLRDSVVRIAAVGAATATDARPDPPDPCANAERSACATEPRTDRAHTEAVAESAATASESTFVEALPVALLCLGLAACLVVGLGPIVRALSTHKQRKRWRAIKGRLVEAARGH